MITASITFKHINLSKHWSNHTHASLLNHAAQISRTIEDIKSYLRANLYPAEVSQVSCYSKGLLQIKWCLWLKAGHTKRSWRFLYVAVMKPCSCCMSRVHGDCWTSPSKGKALNFSSLGVILRLTLQLMLPWAWSEDSVLVWEIRGEGMRF